MINKEYLKRENSISKEFAFVDITYGKCFVLCDDFNNSANDLVVYVKTPWSNCRHMYNYEYNAIRLGSCYKKNMSNEEYDKYVQTTFVFINYEEKVMPVEWDEVLK